MITNYSARWIFKYILFLFFTGGILVAGCSRNQAANMPADFYFMMDVGSAETGSAQNINIKIDSNGRGRYEYYDTGGVIRYDLNDIVTYKQDQVESVGSIQLSRSELGQLWEAINENHFFDLKDNYEMAIGHSYAFVLVQADEKLHQVNNIGMEVPEIRALVETVQELMPDDVKLEYGAGYIPGK